MGKKAEMDLQEKKIQEIERLFQADSDDSEDDNVNVNKFALSNVSFLIVWRWNSEGTEAKPSYDYVAVRERLAQGLPLCISELRGLYRYHQ